MIQAIGLQKTYGKKEAVRGVDLEVERGTLHGFLGPNGAGKTTTIRMLTGLIRPSAGEVGVAGVDVMRNPLEAKRHLALVPDEPALFEKLTAREFLRFVGDVYEVEPKKARQRSEELLEMFGLVDVADEITGGCSHGMRQKTALAAALLHEPEILFLHEPTVGLDPARPAYERRATPVGRAWRHRLSDNTHPGTRASALRQHRDYPGRCDSRLRHLREPARARSRHRGGEPGERLSRADGLG